MSLVVSLNEQRFALPLDVVTEIFLASPPRAAIRAPFGCLGLVEVRGELVPLLDLATLLGLRRPLAKAAPGEEYLRRSIVLTQIQGAPLCLLVDNVVDVLDDAAPDGEGAGALPHGERGQPINLEEVVAPVRRRLLARVSLSQVPEPR